VLAATACGGGNPAGPAGGSGGSLAAGTVLTFVSARDGGPAAGAAVSLGGTTYTADAQGQVTLDRALDLSPAPPVEATSGAFLDRRTLVRAPDERRFTLWPRLAEGGFDEAFTAGVVYTNADCPFDASARGPSQALQRPARGAATLVLGPDFAGNEAARDAHERAVAEINGALAGIMTLTVAGQRPAAGLFFDLVVDPADANCPGPEAFRAVAYTQLSAASEIVGGRIVYCSVRSGELFNLVLHETGHLVGLRHAADRRDVMFCSSGRPSAFSERERLALRLLFERRTGNRFPDDDRQSTGALSVARARAVCSSH
jgi:hypothetical protein